MSPIAHSVHGLEVIAPARERRGGNIMRLNIFSFHREANTRQ